MNYTLDGYREDKNMNKHVFNQDIEQICEK